MVEQTIAKCLLFSPTVRVIEQQNYIGEHYSNQNDQQNRTNNKIQEGTL